MYFYQYMLKLNEEILVNQNNQMKKKEKVFIYFFIFYLSLMKIRKNFSEILILLYENYLIRKIN